MLSGFLTINIAIADEPDYQTITVQEANQMINQNPNIVILDVRNESEYDQGHLYDATLLPLNLIENWDWNWSDPAGEVPYINFLQAHANDTIIVYCKAGSRSGPACQILVEHGITNVQNMEGGITAWMQAEYPIYTKNHYVSVEVVDEELLMEIEPWLLYQADCISCQNQTCTNASTPITNTTITVLEENENQTIYLFSALVNGTSFEYTVTKSILWSSSELKNGVNRTTTLISTESTIEGNSTQIFNLKYQAQHQDYNVTVHTTLIPSDDNSYKGSITQIGYEPSGTIAVKSKEIIVVNSSVTLSDHYKILSTVMQKLGREYIQSEDEALRNIADNYFTMKSEIKPLARIVHNDIPEYNQVITGNITAFAGVGLSVPDPELMQNGSFESGSSYWTLGATGNGEYGVTNEDLYSGSYSLRLGWKYNTRMVNDRAEAYQTVTIPAGATNVQLSFII